MISPTQIRGTKRRTEDAQVARYDGVGLRGHVSMGDTGENSLSEHTVSGSRTQRNSPKSERKMTKKKQNPVRSYVPHRFWHFTGKKECELLPVGNVFGSVSEGKDDVSQRRQG